ncbi:MAG: MBOAT family O-acyltransferase [Pirellulaceae bacterium]
MLFHTWLFAVFFAVVCVVYFSLARTKLRVAWLLVASYVFYAAWNPYLLLLIVYSTALDYVAVAQMDQARTQTRKRAWLIASIVNNLGVLAFFKYANFFIDNTNSVLSLLCSGEQLGDAASMMPFGWKYILPVGISFFTFQSMSYSIDFYRGQIRRERSFIRFAAFVSLFPQLVAGPIERASSLLPQLNQIPKPCLKQFSDGASLFLTGLFKKVALANYLAVYVERVYETPADFGAPALMLATFCFAWQIYFDFSGYTDMARGVALVMGFRLMRNFNHPYLANGIGDFWGRWHISLSTWFRDYLYVPLGGSRCGPWRTWRNLLIVFVVSGFWHGANWTFVVWGALHAAGAIATRALESADWYRNRVPLFMKRLWVFLFVCFAWVFFRAESMDDALVVIRGIFAGVWEDPACPAMMLLLILAVWCYQWMKDSRFKTVLDPAPVKIAMSVGMILYLVVAASGGGAFIYFQF